MNALRDYLLGCCETCGIELDIERAELMIAYLEGIYKVNDRVNVTRIQEGRDAVVLHVVDSLLPFATLGSVDNSKILDIGSGGGFPGVPVAVYSGVRTDLLDSVAKKLKVVEEVLHDVGLCTLVKCIPMRVEDLARKSQEAYGTCLARAVAPLDVTLEYATPLLAYNGIFISYKSSLSDGEWSDGLSVASHIGLECVSRETLTLPNDYGKRTISVWKKTQESEIQLPRKTGLARKRPLTQVFHVKQ